LHGSATARVISKAEVKPYVKLVEKAVKTNASHPAVQVVLEALDELLQRSVEEASRIYASPRPNDTYARMYLELNRLSASGLTAMKLFTTVAATTLYCNWSNIDGDVLFCAIARHALVSRQLGQHRHDDRIGSRPIRCGLQGRLLLGRTLHGIVFPVLEALSSIMMQASELKSERQRKIQQALALEPLKVPGQHARTKGGTVITTHRAK
jgi:hypothetical protein